MNRRRIAPTLNKILALTLPAAGCGIDLSGFEQVSCAADGRADLLGNLELAEPADYIELRRREVGESARVEQAAGSPCASATDVAACQAAIAAATAETGFRIGQCVQVCEEGYLVVNRGQEVTVIDSVAGVLAMLGEIDTPGEAVLVATLGEYTVPCDDEEGGVQSVGDAHEVIATRITADCDPVETTLYRLLVSRDGKIEVLESEIVSSESGVCIGRRPEGLHAARAVGPSRLGVYWGDVAHLEAASVHAFATLRRELAHHGAPARLLRRAERSMRDEVRHAALTRSLAARHGVVAPRPRVARRPARGLEAMAVENAAEGCVRETFGALVGLWQARAAFDPLVRRAMRGIARDELRHATLSWEVDAWLRPRLSPAERARVEDASREALEGVREGARAEPPRELVRWAGLPDARSAGELARRFCDEMRG